CARNRREGSERRGVSQVLGISYGRGRRYRFEPANRETFLLAKRSLVPEAILRVLAFVLLVLTARSAPIDGQIPAKPIPAGNYHAHLVSPAASRLSAEPAIATIILPAELGRIFDEYERASKAGDDSAFAALFTDDALFPGRSGWLRGHRAIREDCCPGQD